MELYDFVEVLKPFKISWCIRVKVLKRWFTKRIPRNQKLKMVLVDEMGCKILASIATNLILDFNSKLEMNQWVCIRTFKVKEHLRDRRPAGHDYKIHFLPKTTVDPLPNLSDSLYLSTVKFAAVLDKSLDPTYAIDLIGYISKITEFQINEKAKKLPDYAFLLVEIQDSEHKILECAAIGEIAEEFHDKLIKAGGVGVVCVFRGWYINTCQARPSIQSLGSVSEVLVNPDIPYTRHFKNLMKYRVNTIYID